MTNIISYVNSLKVTWIRTLIILDKNVHWKQLLLFMFPLLEQLDLFEIDLGFLKYFKNVTNPFRRNCLKTYVNFANKVPVESFQIFTTESLYYNGNIQIVKKEGRKEMFYLTTHSTHFYLRLYGVRHMVKDHSDSEKGNPQPSHRLLFPISSKGYFICTLSQTG